MKFTEFPKIPRLSRRCIITEKIDGTNASIFIEDRRLVELPAGTSHLQVSNDNGDFIMMVGSRTRWINRNDDNYGFANWVSANQDLLVRLGPGHHFGEWWGQGIQRNYGLKEKRFSLFNTTRWTENPLPDCCSLVPVLYDGMFETQAADEAINFLRTDGSQAAPGFAKPEGIIIYHVAGNLSFKKTIEKDEVPKGKQSG